jgi:hypothetical protein
MATITKENPFGIDPARDLHHSPPRIDVPLWSENLLFTGVDSENGVFYYHHLGLVANAPDVWRGDFAVAFPDRRQLLQVTFGNSEGASAVGDRTLHCECIEPLKSWRVVFKGAAYLTDYDTNAHNMLAVDQIPVKCEFDIRWDAVAPMHQAQRNEGLSSGFDVRFEQGGRFWGALRFADEAHPLNGYGYRDHSVGPRDYSKFSGHVWQWGTFPSGRVFGSLNMDEGESLRWKAPYVVIDGELIEGEYVSGPYWGPGRDDYDEKTCELVLRAGGTEHRIQGELLDYGYYWTLFNPSQLCFGRVPARMAPENQWVCKEIPTKWTWDGEEAVGLVEISRRLGI